MMTAQETLLNYAKTRNNHKNLTDQQFIGKAITEGIRIADKANGSIVIVNIKREGKTIIVSETVKTETVTGKESVTTEIFQVNV